MTGRTSLRKRKQPVPSPLKKKRKLPSRKAKREEPLGECEINGTKHCSSEKSVALVKFDNCSCKRMCMPCAKAWLKNSSTCPFCRAQVSLVNNTDVEFKRQREDHDLEQPSFRFPYTDWLGNTTIFQANIETSRVFANRRAKFKLPKEIVFMVKAIESYDLQIVHDNGYYIFVTGKLDSYRGKRRQALYRILFYFAMHEQNPIAFYFLMTLLRKNIQRSHALPRHRFFDLEDDSKLEISKGLFYEIPHESLFQQSALTIFQRHSETHYWHMLFHPLTLLYPQLSSKLRIGFIDPPSSSEDSDEEEYGIDFFRVLLQPRLQEFSEDEQPEVVTTATTRI